MRNHLTLTGLTLLSSLALLSGGAQAQTALSKADSFLQPSLLHASKKTTGWISVVVKFTGKLSSQQSKQLKALQADTYRNLDFIGSAGVRVPTRNLKALAALPFVERLSSDTTVKKSDEFITDDSGATATWNDFGYAGWGVNVAVLDSGIKDNHPDMAGGVIANVKFNASGSVDDPCGHGTHVAGIIAGFGCASQGFNCFRTFYGVAPGAYLVDVAVLDGKGQGTVTDVIAGIQWVIANKDTYAIRVINLSLGHAVGESYKTDPLCQAVEAAWKAGIVVVCAAGNNGRISDTATTGQPNEGYGLNYGSIQSPANDPYVITVGALKRTDTNRLNNKAATYSSRGPSRLDFVLKPDLVAPGNQVISTLASSSFLASTYGATNAVKQTEYKTGRDTNSRHYFRLSGTSMAAPVVSGAVAILLEKEPWLTPDTVKARLMLSADKLSDKGGLFTDPCSYGAGMLNIYRALQNTAIARSAALSPTLSQDSAGNVYINTGSMLGANQVIWGLNQVADLKVVWGSQVIWGSSTNILNASRVIWGSAVWGNQVIWGATTDTVDLSSKVIKGE
jgi:serine protease AprX